MIRNHPNRNRIHAGGSNVKSSSRHRNVLNRALRLEPLEDRRLLAVTLTWAGAGNLLTLTENTAGAAPAIVISEPTIGLSLLMIDLGAGQVFGSGSTTAATGLTYENAGSPTSSHFATIDISAANRISSLVATLPGDGLTLGVIRNVAGGIASINASAGTIFVAGVDTTFNAGAVDLRATGSLTVSAGVTLQTGTGAVSLAADTKADGTGDDGAGTLLILANSAVQGASIALRGADVSIDTTASVGSPAVGNVVTTMAGTAGQTGSTDGTSAAARFNRPAGVAVDASGNVYVADYNNHVIRVVSAAGVVTTLAGTAGVTGSTDGTGAAASFNRPAGVAVDGAGNVYVADSFNHVIRKITAAGVVTTLAGTAGLQGVTDGTGAAARFSSPMSVAVDSAGNVYVADYGNHVIRKITAAGVVTTLAGTAGQTGSVDGTGAAARFNNPLGVAVDSTGNVYVADALNNTIRKITAAGVVTTLAGTAGQTGSADGTGAAARFNRPTHIAVDRAGNVYVSDYSNQLIRKITAAGVVTTLAGSAGVTGSIDGVGTAARFNSPLGIAVDVAGNLFVGDFGNHVIRRISAPVPAANQITVRSSLPTRALSLGGGAVVAGVNLTDAELARIQSSTTGSITIGDSSQSGDIWITTARIASTAGAGTTILQSANSAGHIFLDDQSGSIALNGNGGAISLTAGAGGINAVTSNNLWAEIATTGSVALSTAGVMGSSTNRIQFDATNTPSRIIVGSITLPLTSAFLDGLGALNLGTVTSLGGNASYLDITARGNLTAVAGITATVGTGTLLLAADTKADGTGDDGVGTLSILAGTTFYGGTLSLRGADMNIDPTATVGSALLNGVVVGTLAGSARLAGSTDGTGSAARFNYPTSIAIDSAGNMYVADKANNVIRKITSGGAVTTLAGTAGQSGSTDGTGSAARFNAPSGVAVDSAGNVYVADRVNNVIRKITAAGVVTTLAGLAGQSGSTDDTGSAARFNAPVGVAVDSAGNVYVADYGNNVIRKITSTGVVTTLAGTAGQWGSTDGTGILASFDGPSGLAVDSIGNVYVADSGNNVIRKFTAATGVVSTLAGTAGKAGSVDGTGSEARFWYPLGVTVDSSFNVYVADWGNNEIRKITPAGVVTTLAGASGQWGAVDGSGAGSLIRFDGPSGIGVDIQGSLYVADQVNQLIRKITPLATTNQVTIGSSLASRPMSLGGVDTAVAGINLTDVELARIRTVSTGSITIGDSTQTGDITFTSATVATTAGEATVVLQATAGTGHIILDSAGSGVGLNGNTGVVTLTPGTGGLTAPMTARAGVPLTSKGFTIPAGTTLSPALNLALTSGTQLTLINNTAGSAIVGTFTNLTAGTTYTTQYLNTTYYYQVNYAGGDGNDLTLLVTGVQAVVDNSSGVQQGTWITTAGAGGYGNDFAEHASQEGASNPDQLRWNFTVTRGVTYQVSVTWVSGSDRATNTSFLLSDGSQVVKLVYMNQQASPNDFTDPNGVVWENLGLVTTNGTTLSVVVSADANGKVIADAVRIEPVAVTWSIVGTGDFNGDGTSDLLWRRSDNSGEVRIWTINGATGGILADIGLPVVSAGWSIAGVGDFNGDGTSDLVWRRSDNTGEARIWTINGATGGILADIGLPSVPSTWKIVGVGDFNGDGKSDIVWRRSDDRAEARIWTLNGGTVLADKGLPSQTSAWKIAGVGDFNGDHVSDLVWRRDDTGDVKTWTINGANGSVQLDSSLPLMPVGWKIVGIGDFNGDGKSDLVWRQTDETGSAQIWELDGTSTPVANLTITPAVSGWKIAGVGDFKKNGKSDLLWRRTSNLAEPRIWELDGGSAVFEDIGVS